MEGNRIPANEQVLSPGVVQRSKQISEVGVHCHRALAIHVPQALNPTPFLSALVVGRFARMPGRRLHRQCEA